jgi:hypothetical protein
MGTRTMVRNWINNIMEIRLPTRFGVSNLALSIEYKNELTFNNVHVDPLNKNSNTKQNRPHKTEKKYKA